MKIKRLLAAFLSMAMIVGSLPAFVYAKEVEPDDRPVTVSADKETTGSGEDKNPDITVKIDIPDETVRDDNPSDNDELFKGYIEKKLSTAPTRLRKISLGSRLTGTTKALYSGLVPEIKKVAEGTRTSTEFYFTLDDLGLTERYTAEQLGVQAIIVNGSLTSEAVNAMKSKFNVDSAALVQALMQDCTYEMYWFDKTIGMKPQSSITIGAEHNGTEYVMYFSGSLTLRFTVAKGYASGDELYVTDTSKIDRVNTAIANAAGIVNSAKNKPDLEKLKYYRDVICDSVVYDQTAADDDSTPYGDPWQLISVFDNDSGTNVVCEGYSKAFKYLCDLTSFEHKDIFCITVSGVMKSGTGGGDHMWNIVKMDDGKYYHVDVTNCDSGSIGNPDLLFLKGCYSGSVSEGYKFKCRSQYVTYTYAEKTLNSFSEELAVSSTDYKDCIASGSYGTNLTWIISNDGVLTITGSGDMKNYGMYEVPWKDYKDSVKSVVFDGDITTIGGYAFTDWTQLTSFVIPENVTKIGMGAFSGCSNLKNITIPGGVTLICSSAFKNCTSLENVNYGSDRTDWENIIVQELNNPLLDANINFAFYSVSVDAKTGGTAAADVSKAKPGDTVTLTISPETGYELDYIKVNKTVITTNTFTMPSEDVTVEVGFKTTGYKVTVTAGTGGTAVADKESAKPGEQVTVTPTPDEGYEVDTVTVNGSAITGLAFTMGAGEVTVNVTFKKTVYTVDVAYGTGGTASVDKNTATIGENITITIAPDEGYEIDTIKVNDVATQDHTFTMGAGNAYVKVTFKPIEYAITVNYGNGGKAYADKEKANAGETITVNATADSCYELDTITVNGSAITGNTFTMPADKVTVVVTFKAKPHTLTPVAGKDPTCEEAGYEAHYKCTSCEKLFSDANGEHEISKPAAINKLGHDLEHIPAVDPTKDTPGNIEYYKCTRCNKLFEDAKGTKAITDPNSIVIPAIGHDLEFVPAKAPTCTENGNIAYYRCKDPGCNKIFLDKFGRNEAAPEKVVLLAGHQLEHIKAKAAKCTEPGNREYWKCSVCKECFSDKDGKNKIEASDTVIAATGHHPDHVGYNAPTHSDPGNKEYYSCPDCGKRFSDEDCKHELTENDIYIPPIGSAALGEEATNADGYKFVVTNAHADGTGTVAFIGVENPVESVNIPATVVINLDTYKVTKIAAKAFYGDTTIKTVYIGANIAVIDSNAFFGCSNLVKVSGGARLKTIGTNAFARCPKLSTFVITSTVLNKIGPQAFYKDSRLKTVCFRNTAKLTKSGVKKSLKGSSVKTVRVKKSKVKKYKKYFTKKNCGRKVKVKK